MAHGTVYQLLCAGDPQPAVLFDAKPDQAGYFILPCPYLVILELPFACLLGKTETDIGGILLALFGARSFSTRPNTKICAITLLSATGLVIYKKSASGNLAQTGAVIPLTLVYKLNSVCNAMSSPPYRQTCLQS